MKDRLVVASMVVTMGGIVLGALLAEPRLFGIDALIVVCPLIVGWLLVFGLVVGVLDLWTDWVHVTY